MQRTRRNTAELVAAAGAVAAKAQLNAAQKEARHQLLVARQKAQQKKQDKKRRDRQLIVLGGAMLAHLRANPVFAYQLQAILIRNVTRPADMEAVAELMAPPTPSPSA